MISRPRATFYSRINYGETSLILSKLDNPMTNKLYKSDTPQKTNLQFAYIVNLFDRFEKCFIDSVDVI